MNPKSLLKISFFLVLIFLLSISCEKESIVLQDLSIDSPERISPFEDFNTNFAGQQLLIDWNSYSSKEDEIVKLREYTASVSNASTISYGKFEMPTRYTLLATK